MKTVVDGNRPKAVIPSTFHRYVDEAGGQQPELIDHRQILIIFTIGKRINYRNMIDLPVLLRSACSNPQ